MAFKESEKATVVVEGRRFHDWETVFVQIRWADPWPIFRFTAAERSPIPDITDWQLVQFRPGDDCAVYLGGHLAISGVILLRQTAYDANSHGVMLQGVGITWYAARGSIIDKKSNFDNMSFQQVAQKVIAPFGVGLQAIGKLDNTPFKKLQCEPGETVWNFLERIARPRGIVMGSDAQGNLLMIGDHVYTPVATLVEGDNILRANVTFSKEAAFSDYIVRGQTPGGDDKRGRDASEQEAKVKGSARRYSPLLTPAEQPVWGQGEVAARAKNEAGWHEYTDIQASITVYGWFMPGGGLWKAGDKVTVHSPMAMLHAGVDLKIQTVTFTQDSQSGTLTVLDLVSPHLLKDKGDMRVGAPVGDAKPNTDAPETPPAATVAAPPPSTLSSA